MNAMLQARRGLFCLAVLLAAVPCAADQKDQADSNGLTPSQRETSGPTETADGDKPGTVDRMRAWWRRNRPQGLGNGDETRDLSGKDGAPPEEERATPPPEEQQEEQTRTMTTQSKAAMGKAMQAAENLKSGFFSPESMPPGMDPAGLEASGLNLGPGGPKSAAGASGPSGAGGASPAGGTMARPPPNPARPSSMDDLMLASVSGFKGSFDSMGLDVSVGPGGAVSVLRKDGNPASPAELDALKERIGNEPKALMRRPDFFDVISRERFRSLKSDFRSRLELRRSAFQHIGMTQRDRDFEWSESCSRLSGDCNPRSGLASYRKGQYVPPEDLNSIYDSLDSALEKKLLQHEGQASSRFRGSVFSKDRKSRISLLLDGIASPFKSLLGHEDVDPSGRRTGASFPAGRGSAAPAAGKRTETSGTIPGAPPGVPAAEPSGGSARRLAFYGLLAAALIGYGLFKLARRRRRIDEEADGEEPS